MENTKAELTTLMGMLEIMVQQLMGTVENFLLDIQGLKRGKESVQDGESSQPARSIRNVWIPLFMIHLLSNSLRRLPLGENIYTDP